jgi:PAS domain S-box-containing protein
MNAHGRDVRLICQRDLIEALERLPVPAFAFEVDTLTFVAVNRRFEELLGYSRTDFRSMNAETIRPEADLESFRETLASSQSHGLVRARYVRKDGNLLKVKLHYHQMECLNDEGQRRIVRLVAVEFWDEMPLSEGIATRTYS